MKPTHEEVLEMIEKAIRTFKEEVLLERYYKHCSKCGTVKDMRALYFISHTLNYHSLKIGGKIPQIDSVYLCTTCAPKSIKDIFNKKGE